MSRGLFREFVGTVYCTYGQSNTTNVTWSHWWCVNIDVRPLQSPTTSRQSFWKVLEWRNACVIINPMRHRTHARLKSAVIIGEWIFVWVTLQWRHNERTGVSNHRRLDYSINRLLDQRKHQSSTSLAFVRGIHRSPVNSPHKRPVTRKMFSFGDVIMVKALAIMGHDDVKTMKPFQYACDVNLNKLLNKQSECRWFHVTIS